MEQLKESTNGIDDAKENTEKAQPDSGPGCVYYLIVLIAFIAALYGITRCDSSGTEDKEEDPEIYAAVAAENMVKSESLYPNDFEWDLYGTKRSDDDEYLVEAYIKTLNGYGMKVPRKVKVWLKFDGGDMSNQSDWSKIKIIYINESTGDIQTSE